MVLVAAAGNDGGLSLRYPATYAEVVGVAATDSGEALYAWSDRGDWVDVSAPGINRSTTKDGGVSSYAGTSSATPAAAAVVGLARAVEASAAEAQTALQQGAAPLTEVRYDRVDAHRMLELLGATEPTEPEPTDPCRSTPIQSRRRRRRPARPSRR